MKIGIAGGHSKKAPGAAKYINEYVEDRKVKDALINELRARGHSVTDCSNEKAPSLEELREECRIANGNKVDVFNTIHFNSTDTTSKAIGVEVWYHTGSKTGKSYAEKIAKALSSTLGLPNRGAKATGKLHVLNNTRMPAVLTEVCFVSSKADVDAYHKAGVAKVASAIADGMVGAKKTSAPATPSEIISRPVWLYSMNFTDAQKWKPVKNNDGTYSFKCKANGLMLDAKGGKSANGTLLQAYKTNGTSAQKFILEQDTSVAYSPSFVAPVILRSSLDKNQVVDVKDGKKVDKTPIQLYTKNDTSAQKWSVVDLGNGYWTFVNVGSGKVLDCNVTNSK